MALKTPRPKSKTAKRQPLHKLAKRTFIDKNGKATTDVKKAVSLLGGEGKTIPRAQAVEVGLVKPAAKGSAAKPKAKPAAKKSTPAANKKATPKANKAVKPAASKES